jgi:hypothetical protein
MIVYFCLLVICVSGVACASSGFHDTFIDEMVSFFAGKDKYCEADHTILEYNGDSHDTNTPLITFPNDTSLPLNGVVDMKIVSKLKGRKRASLPSEAISRERLAQYISSTKRKKNEKQYPIITEDDIDTCTEQQRKAIERIIKNRESASRSRMKKNKRLLDLLGKCSDLEMRVEALRKENLDLVNRLNAILARYPHL